MKIETERKFLVSGEEWRPLATHSSEITQGYFPTQGGSSVRIRVIGDRANINIKGNPSGCSRVEFEYEIPVEDAWMMLEKFCGGTTVRKTRFFVPADQAFAPEADFYLCTQCDRFPFALELGREAGGLAYSRKIEI